MKDFERIVTLDNEIEAGLMEEILKEEGIPHSIQSNYSIAYDGLFQFNQGWGYIEADPKYAGRIREIYQEIQEKDKE